MGSKKVNYIELFADKAILAIAGIISLVIIFIFVLRGPQIDGQGPSEIDENINRKAIRLEEQLKGEPNENMRYISKQDKYLGLLNNSIQDINYKINFPLPGDEAAVSSAVSNLVYQIPKIGKIAKPCSAVARMVAFVPTEDLSPAVTYESAGKKLEDMDIVTIESSIDVKSLYSRFKESFASRNIPVEKRKEQYAKPVFAKVQLQRQTQQSDGNWSEWQDIPLTKLCYLKKNLTIPEQFSEYGLEMALVQFAKSEFRDEVLQPGVYCNALPSEPWISPSFYNDRQIKLAKQQEELRRLEIEAERARKLQDRSTPSSTRETTTRSTTTRSGPEDMMPGGGGGGGRTRESASRSTRTTAPTTTTRRTTSERNATPTTTSTSLDRSDEENYNAILLQDDTNLENLDKLVFWAHDDTTEPGGKYKYRIRIGVFNPIAGKDWFSEEQKEYRDQTVLWSDFADMNEAIEIPQRIYFFATDVRDVEKGSSTDKTVDVVVTRYILGNWASKKYNVKSGEEIGRTDESPDARLQQAGISSDPMDFSTGAVMVDARRVTEWYGTNALRNRDYYELLYSFDGKEIDKMPVKERYWPDKVTQIYKEITSAIDALPVALLDWAQASSGMSRRNPVQQQTEETQPFSPESGRGRQPEGGPLMMP